MANQSIEEQIQGRVAAFTSDLTELIRAAAIEAVADALGGSVPRKPGRPAKAKTTASTPTKPRKGAKKGKRVRRTMADLNQLMDDILAYVEANQGQRLEAMSAGMGIDSKEMKRPIVLLLESKRIRKEGQRRGTTYYVGSRKRK